MDTLFSHVNVVTMNEQMTLWQDAFVGVADGKIAYMAKKPPEEKPKKRSLPELMALKTYQGMTDEEIQSIIDFEKQIAMQNGRTEALRATDIVAMNEIVESNRSTQQHSEEVLKSVLTVPLRLATIDAEGVVSNGA